MGVGARRRPGPPDHGADPVELVPDHRPQPQTFVPSIYAAKASDFVAARQRVFTSPNLPSRIILPVIQ